MLVGFALEAAKRQGGGEGWRAKRYLRSPGEHLRRGDSDLQGRILIKGVSTLNMGLFSEGEELFTKFAGEWFYKGWL